jgi:hypothetical protein
MTRVDVFTHKDRIRERRTQELGLYLLIIWLIPILLIILGFFGSIPIKFFFIGVIWLIIAIYFSFFWKKHHIK